MLQHEAYSLHSFNNLPRNALNWAADLGSCGRNKFCGCGCGCGSVGGWVSVWVWVWGGGGRAPPEAKEYPQG